MRVETGLFVNWEKSDLLISVVQEMLSKRFKTEAVKGPMLPNNSCELVLHALQPKGANFTGSKELLENYLHMIKESKPNVFIGKLPEVIDLESDNDEMTCVILDDTDESITVINQDDSIHNSKCSKKSDQANITEVVVIDSPERTKSQKRKSNFEVEEENMIEGVEVLDDDVIIVDNSFTVPKSNTICPNKKYESSDSLTAVKPGSHNYKCGEEEEQRITLSPPSSRARKKSKLAYKRPAHLIQPLTQSNQNQQSVKTDSSSNIFNPNAGIIEKRTGLRPIVIDGSNVAISHGMGHFSLKGIKICINFFEKRGHRQIKAFIPQYRKNRDNHDELHKMERLGTIVVTPSRKVDGKILASYDDRYIVQYAAEVGGVIVSTDNFRDLLQENPTWKETIKKRLLMFTWVEDVLMFPQDPLGKNGPSLDDFLKFPD